MTRLSSSQQINSTAVSSLATTQVGIPIPSLNNSVTVTSSGKWGISNIGPTRVSSGGVTVTTISPPRLPRPQSQGPLSYSSNGAQTSMNGPSTSISGANNSVRTEQKKIHHMTSRFIF